jgi:hypothetical protein
VDRPVGVATPGTPVGIVMAIRACFPRLRRLNLPQNPNETLDIRQLENGLERPGAPSRPATPPLATLAGIDALAGALTHGILGTILASIAGLLASRGAWLAFLPFVAVAGAAGFHYLAGQRNGSRT